MKSSPLQFGKEARQLAWPWTMFMLAGVLVLAHRWITALPELQMRTGLWGDVSEWILATGAFLGSLLLVVLPLGSEFQYRTLAMRLAQPIDRREFWRQKILVTVVAVAPLAVVYCLAMRMRYGWPFAVMVASWILVAFAGAIPFTLVARSTLGGMVLNNFGTAGVTFGWTYYERHGQFSTAWLWTLGIVLAGYAGIMIWLGRRMLLRFQAVDGMQASEAFVPRLLPHAVTGWLRCRPTQPLRNLVRREVHLLRVLWPLTLLYVAAWILLVVFRRLPIDQPESVDMEFVLTICFGILIAVLAGTLSLGEEKAWGTHDWHMTAPVSVSLQWAVKLLVALCASVVCAVLLPMSVLILRGWITGSGLHALSTAAWIAGAVVITLAAFWCACVVKSTVQAALWVFPFCFAIFLAFESGPLALRPFHQLVVGVVSRLDAMAVQRKMAATLDVFSVGKGLAIFGALMLAVSLIQSHRFFRAQVSADKLRVIRCALPLIAVAFLCSLVIAVFVDVHRESWSRAMTMLRETDSAIAAWQAADPSDARHPQQLSLNDLVKASPLSDGTQHWLRHSSITVTPAPGHSGNGPVPYLPHRIVFGVRSGLENRVSYSAVVQAANGSRCSLLYEAQKQGPVGFLTAICE